MDVEFVGHDAGFLQQAHVVDFAILHQAVDAFLELDLPRVDALRVQHLDFRKHVFQVGNALCEVGREIRAFLFAHGDNAVQRLRKFFLQVVFPSFVIGSRVGKLQYFGDGENVVERDFACDAMLCLQGLRNLDELRNSRVVVAHGNVPDGAFAERDGKIHRTACELVFHDRLQVVFEVGEVFRNLA